MDNLNEYLVGVVVGGVIGITGGLVVAIYNGWRQDKRWKEEKKLETERSAVEYFRGIFDKLAPFLTMQTKFYFIMGGEFLLGQVPTPTQEEQIKALLPEFINAYKKFIDSGYLALLPTDLSFQIHRCGNFLSGVRAKLAEKPSFAKDWDTEDHKLLFDFIQIANAVRDAIRELLGVKSLDYRIRDAMRSHFR